MKSTGRKSPKVPSKKGRSYRTAALDMATCVGIGIVAGCDARTVVRVVNGESVREGSRQQVMRALKELGLLQEPAE